MAAPIKLGEKTVKTWWMRRSSQHVQRGKRISAGHNFCCRAPAGPGGQGREAPRCLSSPAKSRTLAAPIAKSLSGARRHPRTYSAEAARGGVRGIVGVWHGKARRTLTDSGPACCFFGPNLTMEVWSMYKADVARSSTSTGTSNGNGNGNGSDDSSSTISFRQIELGACMRRVGGGGGGLRGEREMGS